ncbi:MAG TPA: mercury methylation corrinoid protein HgcA [Anaerovoracaceae bacterium]|nr:mercury methylation corrinoid protein HgcA [Anaerovoracaceae bacterium]
MENCCTEKEMTCCCEESSSCDCEDSQSCCEETSSCGSGETPSCCCGVPKEPIEVSAELTFKDKLGAWKARWGIDRYYKVDPGLYFVGRPGANSPVLVTANYKMSFDNLRKELAGISAWILVLDTKGVNVWCAAGKGTFGTEELIGRVEKTGLTGVVTHRTLILPQLGAVGVSAHEVRKRSGFKVVYGPVRAEDIPEFLRNGMEATKEMRTVRFGFADRAVLTPVELVGAIKPSFLLFGAMFLLNLTGIFRFGGTEAYSWMGAVLTGCVLTPMLLPWIPGRAFSFKGWLVGLLWAVGVIVINDGFQSMEYGVLTAAAYILTLPAVSAYCAMNFTGCSTYTSLSGVMKEMKIAVPLIAAAVISGIVLLLAGGLLPLLL